MRFIIREQDSERLMAGGLFRYSRNGSSTGVTEEWRLTEVLNQFRILRIDYDARDSKDEHCALYHLVITADGKLERLKIRHVSSASQDSMDLIVDEEAASFSQEIDHRRDLIDLTFIHRPAFLFSSFAWIGYWINQNKQQPTSPVHYLARGDKYNLVDDTASINRKEKDVVIIGDKDISADRYSLKLSNSEHDFWIDKYGLAVKGQSTEGLRAVETRYIRWI